MGKSLKNISIEVCNFYLPPEANFDTINDAPDDADKATLAKHSHCLSKPQILNRSVLYKMMAKKSRL